MQENGDKLHLLDKLSDAIGERKSISRRQLDDLIRQHNWAFEPGEVEDFLSAQDIVVIGGKQSLKNSNVGNNVLLYSQELANVKILSRDEELKTAYNMRTALRQMLALIPITTVTVQRFAELARDPELYGQFRMAGEESGKRQNQLDTIALLEDIHDQLDILKNKPLEDRAEHILYIQEEIQKLIPSFKVFDRLTGTFDKLAAKIQENENMYKTITNITGSPPEELDLSDKGLSQPTIDTQVIEMFNIRDILKNEAMRTYKHWKKVKKRLERISLVEPTQLKEKILEYKHCMDNFHTAKKKLVESNVRLVMNIAKNYAGYGVDYLDLVQEGNHALLNAVERFDPDLGYRLSTYTIWWIRQGIMQLIARQSRSIRIPTYVISWVRRFGRARRHLRQTIGRQPTDKEIADELGIEEDKVREFTLAMRGEVSIDSPISTNDDRTYEEVIEDTGTDSPVIMLNLNLIQKELRKVLSTLSEKEAKIISLRYGLEDNYPRTLNEIGDMFGLSRERIRQIESKALKKLRSPQYLDQLGAYFNTE